MIKIGILGCGKIAQVRHIPEYAANPDCELVGFFNPTKSRAEDMAVKYGGRVYDTAEELLAELMAEQERRKRTGGNRQRRASQKLTGGGQQNGSDL